MARYGQAFKNRAVARLLPPESAPLDAVAREVGISADPLQRWRADALAQPVQQRTWTAAARLEAVITTAALDEAARNAWCREHGVYPQELAQWRSSTTQALAAPKEARASPQQTKDDRQRIKELERELRRKDKALAETAALLVLSKKSRRSLNAFVESLLRTAKYRPEFTEHGFADLDVACASATGFVHWYNLEHRHSGIRYFTPAQRHAGHDREILRARHQAYTQARENNPRRWSGATRNWSHIATVTLSPQRTEVVTATVARGNSRPVAA